MKGVTGYQCLILNLTWCSSTKNMQIRININNQGSININQVIPCQIRGIVANGWEQPRAKMPPKLKNHLDGFANPCRVFP